MEREDVTTNFIDSPKLIYMYRRVSGGDVSLYARLGNSKTIQRDFDM